MPIRSLFRSNTATTIFLLLLPFFLITVSSYCGDDDPNTPTNDGGSDTVPPSDSGPNDTTPPDTYYDVDPDTTGSGACCWGSSEMQLCIEVAEGDCAGTFHAGASCGAATCGAPTLTADSTDDLFDSISSALATFTGAMIDLVGYNAAVVQPNAAMTSALFNDQPLYECNATTDGVLTACAYNAAASGAAPMPDGDLVVATMELAADVPHADSSHSFIYTFACDSDGQGANNWQTQGQYDWDTYQGTDRWYMFIYDHNVTEWQLTVKEVDNNQQQSTVGDSAARAAIDGKYIHFFIPLSEFSDSTPSCRFVTFGHDGAYNPSDRGSDCDGANPTLPLYDVQ